MEEQEQGSVVSLSKEEQQRDRRTKMVKRGVFERGKLQVCNSWTKQMQCGKMSVALLHFFVIACKVHSNDEGANQFDNFLPFQLQFH